MSAKLDPFIDAIFFGTVVISLDKMGLHPMLIARQAGREIVPTIGTSIRQLLGKNPPSTLEEHCKISETFFKYAQTADPDKTTVSFSNNTLNMNIVDCAFLSMADFGKKLGYKACPLCIQALMESVLTIAVEISDVENFQVEHNGNACVVKIKLVEK
ncbi:MAG: hypothetical protein QW279_12325 [Candidatus Jordarchaeaceae archaeon]